MTREDNAGVRVPPPLIFALPLVAGLILHRFWPLVTPPPGAGMVIRRVGAVLMVPALVLRGPYRFSRNPMYLAMTLLYFGLSCWTLALWPLLFLPVVLVIIQRSVIGREEAYLGRRFGDDYRRY